eukprot:5848471-Amphidinium_carterae.1
MQTLCAVPQPNHNCTADIAYLYNLADYMSSCGSHPKLAIAFQRTNVATDYIARLIGEYGRRTKHIVIVTGVLFVVWLRSTDLSCPPCLFEMSKVE